MKTISLKVSLEPFKTRHPLVFPCNFGGEVNYVTDASLETRKNGNYGGIPLIVKPEIIGDLSRFTPEMAKKYGKKDFTYNDMVEFLSFFQKYYSYLYSNENVYEDMKDYVNRSNNLTISEKESLISLDEDFKEHGGNGFYRWLLENYFGMIDFVDEYTYQKNIRVSVEWMRFIENIPTYMYYVDAYEYYQELSLLHEKYQGMTISDCKGMDDCCECVEYFKSGGHELFEILENWVNRMKERLAHLESIAEFRYRNEDYASCASINFNLERKIEDLGNFDIFSSEYIAGEKYNKGNVCTYQNDVYILDSGNGFVIDSETQEPIFDTNGWVKYIDLYKSRYAYEFGNSSEVISGCTSSSLDKFLSYSIDSMGNSLPGIYKPSSSSFFVQPPENTIIDLPYEIGNVVNMTRLDDNNFIGDILYAAHFYPCDTYGNDLNGPRTTVYAGDNIGIAIDTAIGNAHKMGVWNETIGVDFEYYNNTKIYYVMGKFEIYKENNFPLGVKYIEKCRLTLKDTLYFLSYNESYPIQYYEITYDVRKSFNELYGKELNTNMAYFYLYPEAYEPSDGNLIASPLFRKEETLGFNGPEKVVDNIYIDRGYATILDNHLKICEVNTLDDLIKYGNSSFDIINIEQENNG